jgi:5-methylcytosine-specific restriction endonuclease McrA
MPVDSHGVEPINFPSDPLTREFPSAWKDVLFRRRAEVCSDGMHRYQCPMCESCFAHSEITFLQGDHIWPYSLFGETSWANYQLICGKCNLRKSNAIDNEIRKALADGTFRAEIKKHLDALVRSGELKDELVARTLLRA